MPEVSTTKTTCPYCGVGCGVSVTVADNEVQPVAGDEDHPANRGRLCVKGSALHETLNPQRRLLEPFIHGEPATWEAALDEVAARLRRTIAEHGPQSVALYLSGQLLTEDYYVANKLWKGFVGSANVDTNSRLCMASAVAAHVRSFGEDVVPGCYEDLELADLIVLVGSNAAWAHPVVYQRIQKARRERSQLRLVVIDPRRTDTCDQADLHLPIAPGTDAWLFNGLLAWLDSTGQVDRGYIERHTRGWPETLAEARASAPDIATVAARCGLEADAVRSFYEWFAATPRAVTVFSQGINQSSSGTDKGNAIINCHLATGRVGKPGASPFSITGQPNAMGGREVGGLANQLAVHRSFDAESIAAVGAFWNAPNVATQPGLKAIQLFEAVERGEVKFLWILATNPLVSMPDADRWRRALQRCETVVVSDCVRHTDTTAVADILLPAVGWGEKDGTVTNSERCISRQRAFLPAAGAARPDWWALSQVGQRLGYGDAFAFRCARDVFVEYAALSGINRDSPLRFDISGWSSLTAAEYEALTPRQWPVRESADGNDQAPSARLFGDGQFATADRRARFVAISPRLPAWQTGTALLPFVFNTGRARDQWHTMTRTAESGRLNRHRAEPYVEIHPKDANALGLSDGDIAEVSNASGVLRLRVRIEAGQLRGSLFAPIHWNDQFAASARVDALVPAVSDPQSGQPELKHGRVTLRRFATRWQALLVSRRRLSLPRDDYWAALPCSSGWLYWLAGAGDAAVALPGLLELQPAAPTLHFDDPAGGEQRFAWLHEGVLEGVLLFSPSGGTGLPEPWWIADRLGTPLNRAERRVLLSGAPVDGDLDGSPVVCSCFQVSQQKIVVAIQAGALCSDALGAALRCGTNCGSCIPELNRLIRATEPAIAPTVASA